MTPTADTSGAVAVLDSVTGAPLMVTSTEATPLDQRPAAVYLARLAVGARRSQLGALRTMAHLLAGTDADAFTLPWHLLGYQHTQALRTQLDERYAPATANRMLAALRGVLTECWRTTIPRGRALKGGELRALFAVCADGSAAGARDAALLATLYAGGLRRSEAVALDLADYDPTYSLDASALTVRHGKGHKERIVYVQNGARTAMGDWLAIRGDKAGPLFQRLRKGGVLVPTRLTDQAVLDILQRRCIQAGVKACSPHDLRRTMISDLLDAGADISTVQKLAGHSNVTTTQRYDRRGEAVKAKASGLHHYGQWEPLNSAQRKRIENVARGQSVVAGQPTLTSAPKGPARCLRTAYYPSTRTILIPYKRVVRTGLLHHQCLDRVKQTLQ